MDKKKKVHKRSYERKDNRFMDLRYKSKTDSYADCSIQDLAKKLECSKGTISKLENATSEDDILSTKASLFKKYHDVFGCSYEYLFNDTNVPDPKHSKLNHDSPLLYLDSATLNNLEQMLTDSEFASFNKYMFIAILSDPNALQSTMSNIFEKLYIINLILSDKHLHKAEKEINTAKFWAEINNTMERYLTKLLPNLQLGFRLYEKKEIERGDEVVDLAIKLENEEKQKHTSIIATVINDENISK